MSDPVQIPLASGHVALVDAADAELVLSCGSRWRASRDRSGQIYVKRHAPKPGGGYRSECLHTFLTGWPLVDHVNGNPLDNRRANLRPATSAQNAQNRRVRRDSKAGLKGVRQYRPGKWLARIQVHGERVHLGVYGSPAEAARAYDAAAREHFGEFARLNFPSVAQGA